VSLNFDLTKINDFKNLCYTADDHLHPTTHAIVFGCMATDVGKLVTDKDCNEYADRALLHQRLFGAWLPNNVPLTRADVFAHKGLTTNVMGHPRWLSRVAQQAWDDVLRQETR
jgi:hypothetical protein